MCTLFILILMHINFFATIYIYMYLYMFLCQMNKVITLKKTTTVFNFIYIHCTTCFIKT